MLITTSLQLVSPRAPWAIVTGPSVFFSPFSSFSVPGGWPQMILTALREAFTEPVLRTSVWMLLNTLVLVERKKKQCYAASQWLFSLFLKICQIRKLIRGWGITNQCTAAFLSPRCCWVGCGDGVCRGSLVALGGTQEGGMGDRQP